MVYQRIRTFGRRVLHAGHHRPQAQTWPWLSVWHIPTTIYDGSGDVWWKEDDLTPSVDAADQGA